MKISKNDFHTLVVLLLNHSIALIKMLYSIQKYLRFSYFSTETYVVGTHYFVCVEVLRPSQPNGVMSSTVSLHNHTFTGQA